MKKNSVIPKPIIREVAYNRQSLDEFALLRKIDNKNDEFIYSYPTVYIVGQGNRSSYSVYIGETTNIISRTIQHLQEDSKIREDWMNLLEAPNARMYVIGHPYFNKSLTLDIENRLMMYLSAVDKVKNVYNRRTNPQTNYYTSEYFDQIFTKIWQELRKKNTDLFPLETVIQESALFKASPFHKLTNAQIEPKDLIILKIFQALKMRPERNLIFVNGNAGSGKTVLMSNLFYELWQSEYEEGHEKTQLRPYLLVNHDQQVKVYQQIANKLGLISRDKVSYVSKPTSFINKINPNFPVDLVIIDEAHLLLTQGQQAYTGKNQLNDILERAKVVVAVFDEKQIMATKNYWEETSYQSIIQNKLFEQIQLIEQLRINGSVQTVNWIRGIIDNQKISNIPSDDTYEIKIFDHPECLHRAIIDKNLNSEKGISRLVATYDWEYSSSKPKYSEYWMVKEKDWSKPWNYQLKVDRKHRDLPWSEQPETIEEVGSIYSVQGFDLNYVGLIIGPSVKYRDGKIIFDRNASENKNVTQRRTTLSNEKIDVSADLLRNELNVLMTRGVNGLYIYAVDEQLQAVLKKAYRGELNESE